MQAAPKKSLIVNLHIPYCIRPEKYQHRYYAVGTNEEKNAYMAALKREVLSYEGELGDYEIRAVTLSGGSATVMSPDLLGNLLRTVREHLPLARGAEISVDAHPLTIGTPALTGIAAGHPNRMELLMHSFQDEELEALDCAFRAQHVQNAILFFQRFRLNNVGLTLSYGIPGQTPQSWGTSLRAAAIMHPAHISIQEITVPPLDPVVAPTKEEKTAMAEQAAELLKEQGYLAYGENRFALPHHGWLYQLLRAKGSEELGMGVDARSHYGGYRYRNTNNLKLYIKNAGDYEKITAEAYADA